VWRQASRFGMAEKAAVVGGAVLRHPGKMLAEAAV
jgi:hypothetical protein